MEFLIVLGVLYALCPIVAVFMARNAQRRAHALEQSSILLRRDVVDLQSQVRNLIAQQDRAAGAPATGAAPAQQAAPATPADYSGRGSVAPTPVTPKIAPELAAPATARAAASGTPAATSAAAPAPASVPVPAPVSIPSAEPVAAAFPVAAPFPVSAPFPQAAAPAASATAPARAALKPAAAPARPPVPGLLSKARIWLLSGNLVAKLGLLILFIGVSFLLKYVAADYTMPIELRLAGVALADIALLVWGWRIRHSRPAISLPVQGAALAILMLVVFGSFRLYHLIPAGMAFVLLLVLTAFTCLLAVLQNAVWLATFGIVGGFAVPLLASTGGGSHIGLFSYYAVLNAGVFAIALKRSWRMLNLLGFAFTFIVGTAWGVLKYAPENYLSTQLFLILFFLFYVGIALAYAAHEAPRLKHYVDATLVFGTPLLALGLQFGLVKDMPFGLAFSALALGLFYTGLALFLWRRGSTFKLLDETFLALGIVFGTLALPFALDGRWTSAAWALEGAGIVWVGLRQRQTRAWVFGLMVQAGAWISFIASVSGLDRAAALHDNLWLGFLILTVSALFMATTLRAAPDEDKSKGLTGLSLLFLGGAALWLLAGSWTEILLRSSGAAQLDLLMLSAVLVAIILGAIASRMRWGAAAHFAVATLAVGAATLLLRAPQDEWFKATPGLFAGPFLSALIMAVALFASAWLFERQARAQSRPDLATMAATLLPGAAFCWFFLVLSSLCGWLVAHLDPTRQSDNGSALYALALALSAFPFAWLARRLAWPLLHWFSGAAWVALALSGVSMLIVLQTTIPNALGWGALLAAWLAADYMMRLWPRNDWPLGRPVLEILHTLRTVAPWLMLWPLGEQVISHWLLQGDSDAQRLLTLSGWEVSGSWSRYLPAWAMMLVTALLARRCRDGGWPLAPVVSWYKSVLIPLAALWSALLVAYWNLLYDGAMAPLPYLPLLNPLDLSTGFAILLAFVAYRLWRGERQGALPAWHARMPVVAGCIVYAWLNLMLLRSVSNYMGLPYRFDAMFASHFVQAMLSLVWSVTALILMRHAVRRHARKQWGLGAILLGLVVAKLFLVDLSDVAGVGRIVSFVGVGGLMVLIGYLAPFPTSTEAASDPQASAPQTFDT